MLSVDDLTAFVTLKSLYPGEISTPNIDRLMSAGTTFTNGYAQVALCSPSRTSLLTGQLPATTQVFDNTQPWYQYVDPDDTIFSVLRTAGYFTASAGKVLHGVLPPEVKDALFDTQVFPSSSENDDDPDDIFRINPFTGDPATLADSKTAAWASEFLQSYDSDQPFFLSVGFHKPHAPWDETPVQYHELYDASALPLPYHQDGDLADIPASALYNTGFHEKVLANDAWRPILAAYFAAVSYADDMIGRVLDALESSGLAGNTVVVFFSDHGYHLGDKDIWHKFTLWDSAARTPLVIVDPTAGTPGTAVGASVGLVDVFPTILDLLGLPRHGALEGTSLKPLIEDPGIEWDGAAFTFMYGSWSLRTDEWRYTRYYDGGEELYDIRTDSHEYTNLARDPDYQAVKDGLLARGLSYLAGKHWFQSADPVPELVGTAADDTLVASSTDTVLSGGDGNDLYYVWDEHQTVLEAENGGFDIVVTYTDMTQPLNVECLVAPTKSPRGFDLHGNAQGNSIFGGSARDFILGFAGDDELIGGFGGDVITGGPGDDIINGSKGIDTANYRSALGPVHVDLQSQFALDGRGGYDVLLSIEGAIGSTYADELIGDSRGNMLSGEGGDDVLDGGPGQDTLSGGAGSDSLDGGVGNDRLDGGAGADVLSGRWGTDIATYESAAGGVVAYLANNGPNAGDAAGDIFDGIENLEGSAFDDVLVGANTGNLLRGLSGADTLTGYGGDDTLEGGWGDDALNGGADNDALYGGAGNDGLIGSAGDDLLAGGEGADVLTGGAGRDVLTGGAEADRFVYLAVTDSAPTGAGRDRITDFGPGDRINLSAIDADATTAANEAFAFIGTAAFHHIAGELRQFASGGNTIVAADVNGDAVADLHILLVGALPLTAGNFLL